MLRAISGLLPVNTGYVRDIGTTLSVLLGKGDGTFQAAKNYRAGDDYPDCVAIGDFNSDGHLDLAVTYLQSTTLSILFGNGDGTFQSPQNYNMGYGFG